MHGLINRSVQYFLSDTYGMSFWNGVAAEAGIDPAGFETMLNYDDALTVAAIDSAAGRLRKPRAALLEDYGNFLVSLEPLRRLMRFGGVDYADFLSSLDELPGRAELAVSEISLPAMDLRVCGQGRYAVIFAPGREGFGSVLAGVLRAMADDYGALALIEYDGAGHTVDVELLDAQHAEGRDFRLAESGVL